MQRVRLPLRHHEQQLKCMSRITGRWLAHPSKSPCRFARKRGKVYRDVSRRNHISLYSLGSLTTGMPAAEKLYEQSSHWENGVWLSFPVTSCHVIIIIIINNIIITINITLCMLRMSTNYYKMCFWVGHLTSNKPFNFADLDHDLSSELSNGILTTANCG